MLLAWKAGPYGVGQVEASVAGVLVVLAEAVAELLPCRLVVDPQPVLAGQPADQCPG
ncbi:hypothetical protein ACH4NT_16715 [Streptomyces lydicus]|uniref:hypothetical protein n=1 Tax=Streptomyces lydicus TaxID=47763 RepID=UPI0037BC9197